ncbi:MAG: tetratricopeptide repeat protein [Syntrophaceae bacterium]|jgi:cytochrome c-type biogenesis protein CcmH/NrfG|nr:tetratricopeptide repeat protein [Syntrophaceae bacterium]
MIKENAYLFIAVAFVAGIVAGVIFTVYHEERMPHLPPSVKSSPSSPAPGIPGDIQKQISFLQSLVKEDPQNLKALVELGNLYFDMDQYDSAIRFYARALELDPKNADVRTDMGIMYRRKGDPDRAIAEFKKAAQDDPKHVNSRYNTGVVLLHDKGDIKGAIQAWEEFLKVEPSGPRAENIRNQMEKMKSMAK